MDISKSFLKNFFTSIVFIATFSFSDTFHIATTGSDETGDGSQLNPFATIQHGIDAASDGDLVLVQAGTYVENINYNGKNIVVQGENRETTIIDGNQNGSVVTFTSGEDLTAVLTGFTITNGNQFNGGGIYCNSSSPSITDCIISANVGVEGAGIKCANASSPSITNCIISGNTASGNGGGICSPNSLPVITNCTITGNIASNGAGIFLYFSNPTITNCTISENDAIGDGGENGGGGIHCDSSSPSITDCIISGNTTSYGGGGIYCNNSSSPVIANSTVSGNTASVHGGGIDSYNSCSPTIINSTISENTASWGGGVWTLSSPTITNCTIAGNTATSGGGAIESYSSSSYPIITNCTITGNTAPDGGIRSRDAFPTIANCILWNDSPGEIYVYSGDDPSVTYSDVQGGYEGEGNIDADPLFVNPDNGDYTLQSSSPCIDAGDPESDLDSDGSISDMGAYYYDQSMPPNADNYSLSFDGSDDYVDLSPINLSSSDQMTLMCWINPDDLTSESENTIIRQDWGEPNWLLQISDYGTNINFGVEEINGDNFNIDYTITPSMLENSWHHATGVYDGENLKIYLDGNLVASQSFSGGNIAFGGNNQSTYLNIGSHPAPNDAETFDGLIDEVSIWDTALSQSQILSYMSASPTGSESGLVGYWNFNEGTGTTLTDQTSNGNNGTIVGATWSEDGAPVEPNSIAALTVHEVDGGLGTTVSIPIDIDLMGIDISSTEIRFSGFQDHVNFIEVDTTGTLVGAAGWSIEVNEQEDLLITGSYGSTEISANGTLFKLKFEIPEEVGVEFVPINITHAEMDELEGTIGITDGGISIQELLWGDVSQNGDVSLYDASFVLKYLVGTETLDETQLIVADVTQDATISALDATAIAQYVVEIIDELPVDNTQNLSGGGEFVINEDVFSPGALLEIPVFLTGGNNLLSFEFDISYDSDIVTFENVEWSEMINHFTIEENTEDGSIRFAGMGTIPDGVEGIFATVSLFVASDFNGESLDVTINKSRINESEPIEDLVITFSNTVLGIDTKAIPKVYALRQNYPNPFNPTTQIKYDLPEDALVTINIYDLMGRSIKSLVNSNQSAGYRSIQWNATNNLGEPVSAGMYIYMIQAGEFRQTKKMVLLK